MNRVIGKNLNILRNAAGIKIKDMSRRLGIEPSTYSDYELGLCEIPQEILEKSAKLLGCEASLLLEDDLAAEGKDIRIKGLETEDVSAVAQLSEMMLGRHGR